MRKLSGLCALLGLILLVVLIGSLLRVPPPRPPEPVEAPAPPAGAVPPPVEPTVVREEGSPASDVSLELSLLDAVTREPVDGATATLKEVKSGGGERSYDFTAEAGGIYRLDERPADGPHALSASAPGYECLRWDFAVTARDRGLSAELRPLTDIVVIVENPYGTPVPDAAVTLSTAGWGVFRCVHPQDGDETVLLEPFYQGVSDAEGATVFDSLIPGEGYAVSAAADDMEPARVEGILVEPESPHIVRVVVDDGARIIGTIRDSDGAPGKEFTVTCRRRSEESKRGAVIMKQEGRVRSRDDGYFELSELSPGTKELTIERTAGSRLETCFVRVTARRGRTHDCGVVGPTPLAEGGANLRVQAVDETGTALPGAKVIVLKDNPDPVIGSILTDESGWCSVLGLNPGRVRGGVHLGLGEYETSRLEVELAAGEEKEVVVTLKKQDKSALARFRKLIVRLTDTGSRRLSKIEMIEKELRPHVESDEGEWALQNWGTRSDERSDYLEVRRLRPGSYRVMVVGDGFVTRAEPVFVEDPESEVELVLEEAIEVRGRIVDASSGDGVSAGVTRLLAAAADPASRDHARGVDSDPGGYFALRAFGSWEERGLLEVRADGYATKVIELHPGVGDVGDIALSRGK